MSRSKNGNDNGNDDDIENDIEQNLDDDNDNENEIERSDEELLSIIDQSFDSVKKEVKVQKTKYSNTGKNTARYLIKNFYQIQNRRIRINNQISALHTRAKKDKTPVENHDSLLYVYKQAKTFEDEIGALLEIYFKNQPMSWFFKQTTGIGKILSAGLLAYIDISRAPTAGHIWSYAGLINAVWEKGKLRPWNAELKVICWKIGQSFIKFYDNPNCVYGHVYKDRKQMEWENNTSGKLISQVERALAIKDFEKSDSFAAKWYKGECDPNRVRAELMRVETEKAQQKALKAQWVLNGNLIKDLKLEPISMNFENCVATNPKDGLPMLPPAHIDARASRYAVKLFLSHLQYRWWEQEMGSPPAKPYIITRENGHHTHFIEPPQIPPTK